MNSMKTKGFALAGAAATLLMVGTITPSLNAAQPQMVKCVGIKDKNACPNGCPGKDKGGPSWSIMTKDACLKAGGTPIKIKTKKRKE